tara:strand:+ start:3258 stop:4265 length:1008 start_codon:yes stop_codon:yes gene_type:complete
MVLVTGGTGLVGSHLLLHLVEQGVPVRAIYRSGSHLEQVEKIFSYYSPFAGAFFKKIEWVMADLLDLPSMENAFVGIEKVYHAAALISFDPNDYELLMRTNTEGTANVVNLCIAHKVVKICYVSSIATIGNSIAGEMVDEGNMFTEQHANVYALSKYAAEMEVWRGSQEGLEVVIVNPGIIVGPGFWKKESGRLFTTANKGYSYFPPSGTGFIGVRDVVNMMVMLMDASINRERYISISENLSYREVLAMMARHLGKSPPARPLQLWQLELFRFFDWLGHFASKKGRKLTRNGINSLKHRTFYSNEKAKRDIGFVFAPVSDAMLFSIKLFKEENP